MTTTTSPANAETLDQIERAAKHIRDLDDQRRAAKTRLVDAASLVDVRALSDYDLVVMAGLAYDGRIKGEVTRRTGHTFLEFTHTSPDDRNDTLGPITTAYHVDGDPRRVAEDVLEFKRRFGQPGKTMTVTVDEITVRVIPTDTVRTVERSLVLAAHRAEDEASR